MILIPSAKCQLTLVTLESVTYDKQNKQTERKNNEKQNEPWIFKSDTLSGTMQSISTSNSFCVAAVW